VTRRVRPPQVAGGAAGSAPPVAADAVGPSPRSGCDRPLRSGGGRLFALTVCIAVGACSSKGTAPGEDPNDPKTGIDGGTGFVPADGGGAFSDAGTGPRQECDDSTKQVFLLSRQNNIYRFDPGKLEVKLIGPLQCPAYGAFPTSMAVDRLGFAWVVYSDGTLWKVDTKNASCSTTSYVPDQESFHRFGMGFSTDQVNGTDETLFVADHDGQGLAKIDLKTMKLTKIGPFDGALAGRTAELTGTGDGRLFGFFTTSPAQVGEIAKGSGQIVSPKPMTNVDTGTDWAFSFWGGDFYMYTANDQGGLPQNQKGSSVTRYRPSDGSITVVLKAVGFNIVGAGVSTCAPTTAPPPR
jgi:hypothetical protein